MEKQQPPEPVEGGELPVKPKKTEEDDKDEKNTAEGGDNQGEDEVSDEEKAALEIEQKKYIFSDREWKIIVSVIGTGIIIALNFLTLNMINSLLLPTG